MMVTDYVRRVVDDELDELLPGIAAVSIEGARAVGKTATGTRRAVTVHRLDDPFQHEVIMGDVSRLTRGARPILIDDGSDPRVLGCRASSGG